MAGKETKTTELSEYQIAQAEMIAKGIHKFLQHTVPKVPIGIIIAGIYCLLDTLKRQYGIEVSGGIRNEN